MSYDIQQSTTAYELLFLLVLTSDHISPATGKTPTVTIRKAAGAFGSPSGAVSEIANGWYKVAGNATDSNTLGPLVLHATEASSDPTDMLYNVVAYNPQDTSLGILDLSNGIESGVTPRQAIRYTAASVVGVLAGAATTNITMAAIGNSGTNRITATVDANGNRSAITLA